MKRFIAMVFLLSVFSGCSPSFWGGAAGGAVGAGAGYEYNAGRQMHQLDEDLKAGHIDQKEYDIRKDQIKRGSLTQ